MTSLSTGTEIVGKFFAALGSGQADAAFALLSPTVTWTYHGPGDRIPFAGTFAGPQGVREFFARLGALAEPIEMTPSSMGGADGTVYVRCVERSRVKATGKIYAVDWVHVIGVTDGYIARFDEFLDSAAVAAAFAG